MNARSKISDTAGLFDLKIGFGLGYESQIMFFTSLKTHVSTFFSALIDRADSQGARLGLYVFSALESVIIPIPVDPYLATVVWARRDLWIRVSMLTALASVIGGVGGWTIGYFAHDVYFAKNLIAYLAIFLPDSAAGIDLLRDTVDAFKHLGIWLVLIGAFTPLPYKVMAVGAGLFEYNLLLFVLTSLVGRSMRFLLVGGAVAYGHDVRLLSGFISMFLILVGLGYFALKGI